MSSFLSTDDQVAAIGPLAGRLADVLRGAGFLETERLPVPGTLFDLALDPVSAVRGVRGGSNVLQPSGLPALHRIPIRLRRPAALTLHRLLTADEPRPRAEVEAVLGRSLLADLIDVGALTASAKHGSAIRSEILAVPHRGRLYLSDPIRHRHRPDFCYLGRFSFSLPDLALADTASVPTLQRVLDLGCGPAVGALGLSHRAVEVVGSDLAPRALRFARLNAVINDITNARFLVSDIVDAVDGDFDVVVTHPPGNWTDATNNLAEDATSDEQAVVAAEGGGNFGLELPLRMVGAALDRLRPGGAVYAILFAPIVRGRPYAVEALRQVCADRPAAIDLHPLAEYVEYADAARYRTHEVTAMVRYSAVLRPAERTTVRIAALDRSRWYSTRLRSLPARIASNLTRARG